MIPLTYIIHSRSLPWKKVFLILVDSLIGRWLMSRDQYFYIHDSLWIFITPLATSNFTDTQATIQVHIKRWQRDGLSRNYICHWVIEGTIIRLEYVRLPPVTTIHSSETIIHQQKQVPHSPTTRWSEIPINVPSGGGGTDYSTNQ